ncbi:MAG: tetratricopeptide repeat protein [Anaerolineales bacterium]|nr:tetratricopeptide repeat protein [Anaerolineales bacterium]
MSASNHIINVNETDFHAEVLLHSSQRPVVVDFWAEWCVPCRVIGPILEKLADEGAGAFRLAKLDVDANGSLADQFGVRGIPAVKAFRNGQVVAEFNGLRPEIEIRNFIKQLQEPLSDIPTGKAGSLAAQEAWAEAEELYRLALQDNPDHPAALLGLARTLLAQGQAAAALPILREFPGSREYATAEALTPLAEAMAAPDEGPDTEGELEAVAANAVRLAVAGRLLPALDGLLDVLREDKQHAAGRTRQIFLGLLAVLGEDNPATRDYRAELATLLF